jgi:hypothetical protein
MLRVALWSRAPQLGSRTPPLQLPPATGARKALTSSAVRDVHIRCGLRRLRDRPAAFAAAEMKSSTFRVRSLRELHRGWSRASYCQNAESVVVGWSHLSGPLDSGVHIHAASTRSKRGGKARSSPCSLTLRWCRQPLSGAPCNCGAGAPPFTASYVSGCSTTPSLDRSSQFTEVFLANSA